MKNIIEIEQLSKKFNLHHEDGSLHASLKENLSAKAKYLLNCLKRKKTAAKPSMVEEFWALKDISLNIKEGDRVALMGRNGAGKSTLLKLISRIIEPTKGRLKIQGRVSSLLEVGAGCHPDLTGRENILLYGAIMGMSYKEIKSKFDEIVAFADVEKFLDTPIKRYSSGMFMRLGFSVAAHLDAELLVFDEVLAVGDAQFQERCIKKMHEIGMRGSTILFVSHNVNSVLALCNKGILLEKGELKAYEPIEQCVSRYMRNFPVSGLSWQGNAGDEHIRIHQVGLTPPNSDETFFYQGDQTTLTIDVDVLKSHPDLIVGFSILNSRSHAIARSRLCDHAEFQHLTLEPGKQQLSFLIDFNLFHPGEYQLRLDCSLLNRKKILHEEVILKFAVSSRNIHPKFELGVEKDGISLGNRWILSNDAVRIKSQ